jgi:lycopene beta-cyclase
MSRAQARNRYANSASAFGSSPTVAEKRLPDELGAGGTMEVLVELDGDRRTLLAVRGSALRLQTTRAAARPKIEIMSASQYEVVFVGGGLAAMLLMRELGSDLPERVAVIDPAPPLERPTVHWSYWSRERTPYDGFAIGAWRQARTADRPPESIDPYALRLVRSSDVFAHLAAQLESVPLEWISTSARSISSRADGTYEVATDGATLRARWVFDSVCDIAPAFPSPQRPRAVLSGTGVRVAADRAVFDAATATLLDPLDARSFAYLLPLSPSEALLESASFGPAPKGADEEPLLRYLRDRHPGVDFDVGHAEYGEIPLGFGPSHTAGPRHVLLGTKRGLVKPSAGYGVVRIAREAEHLAHLWRRGASLPPTWRAPRWWGLLDVGFLELAARDPRLPLELVRRVMRDMPLSVSLRFIDEELPLGELASVMSLASPIVTRKS